MRLIDADAVMERIDNELKEHDSLDMFNKETVWLIGVNDAMSYISTAPTVEVVRCKDCIHYGSFNGEAESCCSPCADSYFKVKPDDYCSRGEMRDATN